MAASSNAHDSASPSTGEYDVDRGFGQAIAKGYVGGVIVIALIVIGIMRMAAPDVTGWSLAIIPIGVAVWIGVLGGVIAVGLWSQRHERDLFHH